MSNNFLPTKDAEFGEWASAFAAYVVAHSGELPIIDSTEAAAMQSTVGNFRTKLTAAATAKDAASSAVELKDVAREETEDVIRTWARQWQASPMVTDAQREAMGLPVHGQGMVALMSLDESRPVGTVDTGQRLHHSLKYWDSLAATKARPDFAKGAEVWCAITPAGTSAPVTMDAYSNLGLNSASPFNIDYAMEDGGKTAHYMLRWIGRDNAHGTWSEVLSATIVAF